MKKTIATIITSALILTGAASADQEITENPLQVADHHMEKASSPGTVVNVAANAGQFNTLIKAVQTAGLQSALKGEGPFTILAPTDDAFAALPPATLQALLDNPEELAKILKHHVISGKAPASKVVSATELTTLNNSDVKVKAMDGKVMLGEAKVLKTDIMADNGVIHVIDKVLIPADFDLASLED